MAALMMHWHCLIFAEVFRYFMVPLVCTAAVGDCIGHMLLLSMMFVDRDWIAFRPDCKCHLIAARKFCLGLFCSCSNERIAMQEQYQYLGARQWLRCKNTLVLWAGGWIAMR